MTLNRDVLVPAVLVAFIGTAAAQSPPAHQPEQPKAAQPPTQNASNDVSQPQSTEDALARYTLWLAIFTAVLATSTGGLWYVTWRTLKHAQAEAVRQDEHMQASLNVAGQSAQAAQQNVATTRDSAERQLRAYVSINASAIQIAPSVQQLTIMVAQQYASQFMVRNMGQTPAYEVQIFGEMDYVAWPINPTSLTSVNFNDPNTSRTTLGPGGETRKVIVSPQQLTPIQFASLNAGTHVIVAHGVIRYRDAFGVQRFTNFRHFVGGAFGIQGVGLGQHADGNDSN